jgi:rhamnulokinase
MSVSKFLAFDLGAESGRVVLGKIDNRKISLEEIHRFFNTTISKNKNLFWDVPNLFTEIKRGLSLAASGGHKDIESVGIDTWGVDFGLLGKNNQLLELPHSYRDERTNGIPEKVFEKISADEIYERTAIQFMQINSLYQLYSLKLGNKNILRDCNRLLFMPDLFNFLLTGEKKSEYTIASTSQLMNVKTKNFDERIFSALDLPINIMAPVVKPGTVVGKLLPQIAAETGLNQIDVVAVASHDTASAVAAVPFKENGSAYLSSGTWSLLGIESEIPIVDLQFKNSFTNEGGVDNKIIFLRNIPGLWFLQELKKSWEKKGEKYSYNELTEMAVNSKAFIALIDPDDKLFINPDDMITALNKYYIKTGQKIPQSKGEYVRSVLESLALRYKTVIKDIERISGNKINKIHVVGGGSKNNLLNQIASDATEKQVITGPVEATALGNIIVQAIAKKRIDSLQKARELISSSFFQNIFNPENHEKWEKISYRS